MEGTGSPERDRVDEQIGLARNLANGLTISTSNLDAYVAATTAKINVHLVEALVRQIRDLDDDVWAVKNAILESNADLVTKIDGGLSMSIDNLPPTKKGLF